MNKTLTSLAVLMMAAVAFAPLGSADFATDAPAPDDGNSHGVGSISGGFNADYNDGANLLSRNFITFIDGPVNAQGRWGWYDASEDDEATETVDEEQYSCSYILNQNTALNRDYTAGMFIVNVYGQSGRVVWTFASKDLPETQGQHADDPTGCAYFDQDDYFGFGQGSEPGQCEDDAGCEIGFGDDHHVRAGPQLSPAAILTSAGPFRHYVETSNLAYNLFGCNMQGVHGDDYQITEVVPANLVYNEGDYLVDTTLPVTGEHIQELEQDEGDGNAAIALVYSPLANPCKSMYSLNETGIGQGLAAGAYYEQIGVFRDIIIDPHLDNFDAGESTIGVGCFETAFYWYDPTIDTTVDEDNNPNGDLPFGWTHARQSDYDWFAFVGEEHPDSAAWALDPATHYNILGPARDKGCSGFDEAKTG